MPLPAGTNVPINAKIFYVGLLTRGPRFAVTHGDPALLQQHFSFLRAQAEAGYYKIFGPMMDNGDVAAMVIMQASSLEEAKQIAATDPILTSGRMAIEIHPVFLPDVSGVRPEYWNGKSERRQT